VELFIKGIGVSPGVAIGPTLAYRVHAIEVPQHSIDDAAAELQRYDEAVEHVRESLGQIIDQTTDEVGENYAAIFETHMEMLDDVTLRPDIERQLNEDRVNIEYLVDAKIKEMTATLKTVDDPIFRERIADFVDLGRRILYALMGEEEESLDHFETPSVVVAHELTPSETAKMDMANTLALATDEGGPTSHMAILARAFGIPAVVGLRHVGARVGVGDQVIVDGSNGQVILRPSEATVDKYMREKERQDRERQALISAGTGKVSTTLDGTEVQTLANIEFPIEVNDSLKEKCQGVGLYRTEYLFMNRKALPTEDEQFDVYKHVAESLSPLPITMRTLDIGGDKMVRYLGDHVESNPQLGWRSIRFCLDRPDIFKAQLRAMLRASIHGTVNIMFPMITGVDELREAVGIVQQVRDDLEAREVPFDRNVRVGSMIEVSSAVVMAQELARECDFFSIGTNDLIQYCLAVDRVNERTGPLYKPHHPAVLRMLKQVIDATRKANIPCSICGEMAGDPLFTETLIGMGFKSLSMSAVSLPRIRAEIANTKDLAAKRFANNLLRKGSAAEIIRLLTKRAKSRDTLRLYRSGKQAPGAASPI
jgi:phosphotransferase system enzyme I (PtsI)